MRCRQAKDNAPAGPMRYDLPARSCRRARPRANPMSLQIVTLAERPELRAAIFTDEMQYSIWPEFMRHDPVADLYYGDAALDRYLDFVLAGLDDGAVVARAFSVPFCSGIAGRTGLPDAGWDAVIRWAHDDHVAGRKPNAVSALEI